MPIVGQFGSLAGFGVFPGGALESIATVTVGSGGAASIEFADIPGGFQHLQVRLVSRIAATGNYGNIKMTMNTSTAIAAWHALEGNGAAAAAEGYTAYNWLGLLTTASGALTSNFSASVVDILDYASTSKTKVVRAVTGYDNNNTGAAHVGYIYLVSSFFNSTSAMTSFKLSAGDSAGSGSTFAQHTTAALYGVKAP